MNHQPFRTWLLSDEELTAEQTKALQEHLRDCNVCNQLESSWEEIEAVIVRSPLLEPATGFVERWQVRLVSQQQHQQKLRSWYVIGSTSLLVVSLLALLVFQLWSLFQNPGAYLSAWFEQLAGVLSIFITIQHFASSFSLPDVAYSLLGIVLLFGMISFMSVLWLATYRKFSMVRRQA